MSRLRAKGGGTPLCNALENKKSSEIALRLNSYKSFDHHAEKKSEFLPQSRKSRISFLRSGFLPLLKFEGI
jgi:hypothetical protein